MGHEILRREDDRSVVGQLLQWFRKQFAAPEATEPEPPPRLVSSGRLQPKEDETSGEFAERVARIKADVLARALAAIESEQDSPGRMAESPVEEEERTAS